MLQRDFVSVVADAASVNIRVPRLTCRSRARAWDPPGKHQDRSPSVESEARTFLVIQRETFLRTETVNAERVRVYVEC